MNKASISLVAGLTLALFSSPLSAATKASSELAPSSPWTVDYDAERCSLYRDFGSGDELVTFRIDSFGSLVFFRFLVMGKLVPNYGRAAVKFGLRYTPDADFRDVSGLSGTTSDQRNAMSFSGSFGPQEPPVDSRRLSDKDWRAYFGKRRDPNPEFEAQTNAIALKFRGSQMQLQTGDMTKPLGALRTCVDDLIATWGLDATKQKSLSQTAYPLRSTYIDITKTYPSKPLSSGNSAFVPVRVMVDETGRSRECVIQEDNIDSEFKRSVCNGMAGRFEPAKDEAGNPIAGVYPFTVVYMIP